MLQQPYDLYQPGLTDEYIIGMSDQLAQAMDDSVTEEVSKYNIYINHNNHNAYY